MRAYDWESSPLGNPESWPQSLQTVVRLLLTSRYAMWMSWGPELTFLYNDSYARMTLGPKHPWALGRPAREVWAEIWDDIGPRIETVLSTGEATWDEALRLLLERNRYSEETYHTFSYSPLADEGEIRGNLCVVTEETQRVISERRLTTLRELAAGIASSIGEGDVFHAIETALEANPFDLPFALIYLFDEAGTSARLAARTGIADDHPAALSEVAIEEPAVPPTFTWPAQAIFAGAPAIDIGDVTARFGEVPSVSWQSPPERARVLPVGASGQGRPFGMLVAGINPHRLCDDDYAAFLSLVAGQIATGVSNARAYEAEKQRAEALAQLDKAKTAFFANVSHEFRTPLTLMLAPAEDALSDTDTIGRNRERVGLIHRNALRLLKLVNTILDFTKVEAGRADAAFRPVDLGAYTAELASNFRSAMERAGLRLDIETSPGNRPVYVDVDMWEKIVLNLLSNAFKHTFEGGITVRVFERDNAAVMEVRDTGVGIAAEHVGQLFNRFHRVPHARSRTHEGSGIGLAFVQELVNLHGGGISVESQEGKGSTFAVTLPLGHAHLPQEQVSADAPASPGTRAGIDAFVEEALRWVPSENAGVPASPAPPAQPPPEYGGISQARILVADDNADMRAYIERLLREQGWQTRGADNGLDALEILRTESVDLVLTDIMMPVLDGLELLARIEGDDELRGIPVILISARAGESARYEAIVAGAADYLVKPFSAKDLVSRVSAQAQRVSVARQERQARLDQRRLLAVAETERQRLRALFAQAPAAIAELRGPDHVFESVNTEYSRLVGGRDVLNKTVREALPEVAGQGFFEILDEVYQTGQPFVGRGMPATLMIDGSPREVFLSFAYQPICDDAGGVQGIFALGVDVTNEVTARHEAETARAEAESANRVKSEFLATMSHELRTPLNAIGGYVDLLDMGIHGPITDAQRDVLMRVRRSGQHLLSLINDVLNFAKLEAGRVDYLIEDVLVADVLNTALTIIEPQIESRGLAFTSDVPAQTAVRADRGKLQQILVNLLSNAVKFTPAGGRIAVEASLHPRQSAPADEVHIRVTDTGVGIPRDKQESVFDPFVQVHRNLNSSTEGTGLGLAISRNLARGMKGDLRVRSEEGRGSTFTLWLPAGNPAQPEY